MAEITEGTNAETTAVPAEESAAQQTPVEAQAAPAASEEVANTADTEVAASADAAQDAEGVDEKSSAPELPSDEMSFAEMFELAEKQSQEKRRKLKAAIGGDIRPGQVIFAKIVSVSHDSVFLDVGAKAEGVIPKGELLENDGSFNYKEGDKVEARIRKIEGGSVILSKVLPHQSLRNREEVREAHRAGLPVEGRVASVNKGGFDVEICGLRAFCPASQIDLRPSKDGNYVGQKFPFKIVEFKDGGRNIVVTRRQLIIEENRRKAEELLKNIEVGGTVTGKVTSLKDYGAFVDIGGLEGLVHLSEISHGHLTKATDALKVGQEVTAQVLKIEDGKNAHQKKISLSMKSLTEDPWARAQDGLKEGQKVSGKVARIQAFGAFIEIMPGVDGLVHVSNMKLGERVKNPRDVVTEGQEVEATVISVDWNKRRIGLSLAKTPQELANELRKGSVFDGTIDRIESFGLFVKLPGGARGLVPAAETGTQRGADLKKEFKAGETARVTVLDVDGKSGKIRLSIRAAKEAEERAEIAGYLNKNNSKSKGKGLGTFADLFKAQLDSFK